MKMQLKMNQPLDKGLHDDYMWDAANKEVSQLTEIKIDRKTGEEIFIQSIQSKDDENDESLTKLAKLIADWAFDEGLIKPDNNADGEKSA